MDMTQEKTPEPSGLSQDMTNEDQRGSIVSINQLRRSNGAPPVHQLPTKLLLHIFQNVLHPQQPGPNYYHNVCTLSEVCIRWCFVIQNSPQLWKTVWADLKEEGLRKVLQRSSGHLINVEFSISPMGIEQDSEEYWEALLRTLGSVSERWCTLVLNGLEYVCEDSIKDILQLPAANLERLVLDDDCVELDISDIELFGGNSPKLKDLRVVGIECKWSQTAFKGLENLSLSWLIFTSLKPVLNILRDCPQLQKLEFCDCDVSNDLPARTLPVSLPHLQVLQVIFNDDSQQTNATGQFLDHISAPLHCALYACPFDGWDGVDPLSAAFGKWLFGRQTHAILEGLDGLELRLGHHQSSGYLLDFDLFSGSSTISGGVRWTLEAPQALACIGRVLQRSRKSDTFATLKICAEAVKHLKRAELVSQLNRLPPITRLELLALHKTFQDTGIEGLFRCFVFSKVERLVFQRTAPDIVMKIVRAALPEHGAETNSAAGNTMKCLDYLEIHVEGHDFDQAEKVVEVLRDNPRIGKVDLYVAL
ncbi:hypothetical protein FRC04_001097 [Tulasnella sp. 424]|nr:hypothetical protein FRC04_001097 [Tulasnella sp. 424]KAG8969637.1 hypothetical protein FRC05_001002 [Tulasnella sp. 425]